MLFMIWFRQISLIWVSTSLEHVLDISSQTRFKWVWALKTWFESCAVHRPQRGCGLLYSIYTAKTETFTSSTENWIFLENKSNNVTGLHWYICIYFIIDGSLFRLSFVVPEFAFCFVIINLSKVSVFCRWNWCWFHLSYTSLMKKQKRILYLKICKLKLDVRGIFTDAVLYWNGKSCWNMSAPD